MATSNTQLLVIDVGNTHTVLGVFQGATLRAQWRLGTSREQTADEQDGGFRHHCDLDFVDRNRRVDCCTLPRQRLRLLARARPAG